MSDNHLSKEEARMEELDRQNPFHWLDKCDDIYPLTEEYDD